MKKGQKPRSAQHCNGNMIVAMALKATGNQPGLHDVVQLSGIPLYADLTINKELLPLNLLLTPINTRLRDRNTRCLLREAVEFGYDQSLAIEYFERWVESLDLPYKKYGQERCQIIALVYCYESFFPFLSALIGDETVKEFFHPDIRELRAAALLKNDEASFNADRIPFPKARLRYISGTLGIQAGNNADALEDCKAIAGAYKKICLNKVRT